MLAGHEAEAGFRHAVAEAFRVREQPLAKILRRLEEIQHRDRRRGDHRGERVREEVRPAALPQQLDDLLASTGVAAGCAAERLAEGPGEHIDAAHHASRFMRASPVRPHEPDGVRVVDEDERAMLVREVADRAQVRDDAVHREHAVCRDELEAGILRRLELALEVGHVVVRVAEPLCLREANSVDDARVVQRVADHGVLFREDRLEQPAIRIEARAIEDRVLGAEEARESPLQLLVDVLRPADEADRRHAVAPAIKCGVRGLHDRGVIGESEVVVRAEVDDLPTRFDADRRALWRGDDAFLLVEAALADLRDLLVECVEEAAVHDTAHHLASARDVHAPSISARPSRPRPRGARGPPRRGMPSVRSPPLRRDP